MMSKMATRRIWSCRGTKVESLAHAKADADPGASDTGGPHGAKRRYRAVHLPLMSSAIEQTEDTAVFLLSPGTLRRQKRERLQMKARRDGSPGKLAALGLRRAHSAPAGIGREGPETCSQAAAVARNGVESCCLLSFSRGGADSSTPKSTRSADELRAGIMMRATEQTMMANLRQLSLKQKLRYGPGSEASGQPPMRKRQQVGEAAVAFTELYNKTVDILEANMTLSPPGRCRSIMGIDLMEYDSDDSGSECAANLAARERARAAGTLLAKRPPCSLPGECCGALGVEDEAAKCSSPRFERERLTTWPPG